MNIAEQIQVDKYTERRAAIGKAIDDILKIKSGPRRWRASIALYLNINPVNPDTGMTARDEYDAAMLDADDMRMEQGTKWGEGFKDGKKQDIGMRLGLYAPDWFITQIEKFDRLAFDANNPEARKNVAALVKEFKELCVQRGNI